LTAENKELTAQLDTAQCRVVELGTELGQRMDDVSRLEVLLQEKEHNIGKNKLIT